MSAHKIFCIGFHKTASTSLSEALEILTGKRVCGPIGIARPDIAQTHKKLLWELLDDYDIFKDNPVPLLFRDLDRAFPGSRFILTYRAPEKWIKSVVRHFAGKTTPMREMIYEGHGDPVGHEDLYLAKFNQHNADVREYFKGRTDLLEMDLAAGDGWDKLCAFLDKPHPGVPFPQRNQADEREAGLHPYNTVAYVYGKGRSGPNEP